MKRWLNKIAGFWGGYRRISPYLQAACDISITHVQYRQGLHLLVFFCTTWRAARMYSRPKNRQQLGQQPLKGMGHNKISHPVTTWFSRRAIIGKILKG